MQPLLTNLHIYRAIAEEAHAEALQLDAESRMPKPDGSPGFVVTLDPQRRSFKKSLTAIAFCGVYFEALIYIKGTQLMGERWEKEFDRKSYSLKLAALGISDPQLIDAAERLRKVRNDLVHEKALPIAEINFKSNAYWAQRESAASLAFIRQISSAVANAP